MTMRAKVAEALRDLGFGPALDRLKHQTDQQLAVVEQRRQWAAELVAVRAEREAALPPLAAESARFTEEAVAAVKALHEKAIAVQMRMADLDNRTAGRIGWLERQLRLTADVRLREDGPVLEAGSRILRHLREHLALALPSAREHLAVMRETYRHAEADSSAGRAIAELERRIPLGERAETLVAEVHEVLQSVVALQFADQEEAEARLPKLLKRLPTVCPCGVSFASLPSGRWIGPGESYDHSPMPELEAVAEAP